MGTENETIGVAFRMDKRLHGKLNQLAEAHRRSMTKQMIVLVEEAVRQREAELRSRVKPRQPQPA